MMKKVLVTGFAALALAACDNTVETGTTSGGTTGGSTTGGTGGNDAGTNPNPYGGFECPADPAHPGAPTRYYPGGPTNPDLGTDVGKVFPDLALGGGYWNLTTPVPVLDTQPFWADQVSMHDLYCAGKFKVALIDVSALWCGPCNEEGQDLPIHGAPVWLPQGGVIFSIMAEGAVRGSNVATKADLDQWVNQHQTNYPFILSPDGLVARISNLAGWPTNMFIDLSSMRILETFDGYSPCNGNSCNDNIYLKMPQWLAAVQ
jgi:hypothetical protein